MPRSWLALLPLTALALPGCGEPRPRVEVTQVWAGGANTCATTPDGLLWCWGAGPIGDGTTQDRNRPVRPGGMLRDVTFMSIGVDDTCAIAAQRILCWGAASGGDGSILVGQSSSSPAPQTVMTDPVTEVATSSWARCVQKLEGGIWCWGMGSDGALGNGSDADSGTPVPVSSLSTGVTSLRLGYVRKEDGSVWGWGPVSGANANPTAVGHVSEPVPIVDIDLAPLGDVVQISGDYRWGCGLTGAGRVLCWGSIPGSFERVFVDVAIEVSFPEISSPILELAVGFESMCLLDGNGAVWCWGSNRFGQLGGDTIDTNDPLFGLALVRGLPKRATHIASGGGIHVCATLEDSTLWCWGHNGSGQLGVGDTDDRSRPVQVVFPG